jgi:hypothetical protein
VTPSFGVKSEIPADPTNFRRQGSEMARRAPAPHRTVLVSILAALVAVCGCSGQNPTGPSTPATAPTATPAAAPPIAVMTVRFPATSSYGLMVALQDISGVTFDASASKGAGLTLQMAYGDGVIDSKPFSPPNELDLNTLTHQYHSSGTFNAQLVVTDSQGRQASTTALITVKSLTATWGNVIRNPSSGLTETRLLTLVQTGGSLSGSYTHPQGNSEPLHGAVEGEGTIRTLALDSRTISFSGNTLDDNGVSPDASALKLIVKGGSADGLTLTFSRH